MRKLQSKYTPYCMVSRWLVGEVCGHVASWVMLSIPTEAWWCEREVCRSSTALINKTMTFSLWKRWLCHSTPSRPKYFHEICWEGIWWAYISEGILGCC